jgi:hypothetical protein
MAHSGNLEEPTSIERHPRGAAHQPPNLITREFTILERRKFNLSFQEQTAKR